MAGPAACRSFRVAVSQLPTANVMLTFALFVILFTLLLAAEVRIMCKAISSHQDDVVQC